MKLANNHTGGFTPVTAQIGRDQFKGSFGSIVPMLEDVIEDARTASNIDKIAKAIPELTRRSGIARVSGTARWVLAADGLLDRAPDFPKGFVVHSTEADHNQGKYIFGFPLGVFTFKREPHEEEKGLYLQETLKILQVQEQQSAASVGPFACLKVYVSVPPTGSAGVIVERPDAGPMSFALDEFAPPSKVVAVPKAPVAQPKVRSSKSTATTEGTGADSN